VNRFEESGLFKDNWFNIFSIVIVAISILVFCLPAYGIEVRIQGNRVIPEPILKQALNLAKFHGKFGTKQARAAGNRLLKFLKKAGYDLARVRAVIHKGRLEVLVEEGRLDKILFIGQSNWKTLNLRMEFELPGRVYNKFQVAAELERLEKKYGFRKLWSKVVEVAPEKSLVNIDGMLGDIGFHALERIWAEARGRYELHIFCAARKGTGGIDFSLFYRSPFGLNSRLQYQGNGTLISGDRFSSGIEASAWTQSSIISGKNDFTLTHAGTIIQWYTPALIGKWFRARVDIGGQVFNLQRSDLGLDSYWRFLVDPGLVLSLEPTNWMRFALGIGYSFESLLFLEKAEDAPGFIREGNRKLPFLKAGFRFMFDKPFGRLDKEHALSLDYRDYRYFARDNVDVLTLSYQKYFLFGYDELVIRLFGAGVWGGGVKWMDEISLTSGAMRVVAGDSSYTRKLGEMSLEFNLALVRDLFKIGIFAQAGLFGELNRETMDESPGYLTALGPSVHLLILDTFQLDVYYGFGFREDGAYRAKVSFDLRKAY